MNSQTSRTRRWSRNTTAVELEKEKKDGDAKQTTLNALAMELRIEAYVEKLSPVQCPTYRPLPANDEREITTARRVPPLTLTRACCVATLSVKP